MGMKEHSPASSLRQLCIFKLRQEAMKSLSSEAASAITTDLLNAEIQSSANSLTMQHLKPSTKQIEKMLEMLAKDPSLLLTRRLG